MDPSNLARKDTTKGPPLRILSLDGGGVRGYSMLILLQDLMHRIYVEIHGTAPKRHEIPKPCDHFDLIAGTGTGGLIAIMLGRLRLDLDTCKEVYVRMTRKVFETDKTFAGIPYRSTLFKASKLEEAIRECVREHTVFEDEGNDNLAMAQPMTSAAPATPTSQYSVPQRTMSNASRTSFAPSTFRSPIAGTGRWGDPNALLYDVRDNRTKTAVTAVYKGTPSNGTSALLRSYDSRREPAPEFNCTIWQAGRATSATALAFKPIQIGQSVFIDEGSGRYNPAPQVMDEAVINEWPGRDIGVFVSIGTGKRPNGTQNMQSQWWEGFLGGSMGDFAEAKKRLMSKIEGCEDTHQYMLREHLSRRRVQPSNYYRLNVEVGVGEFGMNEWHRLSDISSNTRMYLSKQEVQNMNHDATAKMARIYRAKMRFERGQTYVERPNSWQDSVMDEQTLPPPDPLAVELPGDQNFSSAYVDGFQQNHGQHYEQVASHDDKFAVLSTMDFSQNSQTNMRLETQSRHAEPATTTHGLREGPQDCHRVNVPDLGGDLTKQSPPPVPPKTLIEHRNTETRFGAQSSPATQHSGDRFLPYPLSDRPPPAVNMANKPRIGPE